MSFPPLLRLFAGRDPAKHPPEAEPQPRSVCYGCFRPVPLCYCDRLPHLDNRTHVVILQHPRERFHPLGTARIVARGLRNVSVVVLRSDSASERELDAVFPVGSGLLYPGEQARDLASVPVGEHPSTLVVLDGTWHHARTMYRDNPALWRLPQFHYVPERPTEYRVRREPKETYVSTVEAVAAVLEILEPGASYQPLLKPFRRMVDLHLEVTVRSTPRRRQRKQRPLAVRHLPRALVERFARAVVVYGEATDNGSGRPQLCYWTAKRLRDACVFSELVAPTQAVAPERLRHWGLSLEGLEQGVSLQRLRQRWREFLRSEDIVLAWNASLLELMAQLERPVRSVSLKAAYRGFKQDHAQAGSLEQVVQAEGLSYQPLSIPGRAAYRLAQAEAVARQLHALANGS